MLKIEGGTLYDPSNEIRGEKRDIWVEDGRIIAPPGEGEITRARREGDLEVIDADGLFIMPGGIDIHTHIAGPKVNTGRVFRPEDHRGDFVARRSGLRSGVGATVPSTFVTGYRYTALGYTTVIEAAAPPLKARHVHEEFADIPFLDKGFLVLVGNNYFVSKFVSEHNRKDLRDFLGWLLEAAGGFGLKVVNPGGVEAWMNSQEITSIDDKGVKTGNSPREILQYLADANDSLSLPHSLHIHTNRLGQPGNYKITLDTIDCLQDYRKHITHIQFSSYARDDESRVKFASESGRVASKINSTENITVDIGQIIFGEATTMTADSKLEYSLHHLSKNKWVSSDIEMETGSGIVPMTYSQKNLVNGIQWAVGLELFLKIDDPWKVFLTTDHPNAGPFTSYPEVIKLLMNKDYREEVFEELNSKTAKFTDLMQLKREYSLDEIAVITRSGPARALGLKNKGHLGIGADADLTIYSEIEGRDIKEVFSHPEWVIKSGKIVIKEGDLVTEQFAGRTLVTRPDYDRGIIDKIEDDFRDYYSISINNYPVTENYIEEVEVVR